jgi:hypothetical protein
MRRDRDRDYHIQRARTELDWAYRAERRDVAAAHLRLSSLHMERVKALSEPSRS